MSESPKVANNLAILTNLELNYQFVNYDTKLTLVYGGEKNMMRNGVEVQSWLNIQIAE
ncbi:hypothetical protein MTYP_02589 [Methylophilaceae bacterium]|nr:hypothetical protein MTYP_02589 [Methylophilaceae bacterium]